MEARNSKSAASPILVTGGTGTLGRLVVAGLRDVGRDDLPSYHAADTMAVRGAMVSPG